jgi:phosphinothricin acetyltransferase
MTVMAAVTVRAAKVGDVETINEIHGHYALTTAISFDVEPWTNESRLAWLDIHPPDGPHRAVVAVEGDAVIGWASSSPFASKVCYATSVECSVFVRDGHGGRGIGTALYDALFASIAGEDVHRMYAGVTLPNDASLALHERFGFEVVGTYSEVGRKFGRYHDVVWLERALT